MLDFVLKDSVALFPGTTTHQLPNAWHEKVECSGSASVDIFSHVKRFECEGVVDDEHWILACNAVPSNMLQLWLGLTLVGVFVVPFVS